MSDGVRTTLVPIFARQLGSTDRQIGFIVGSAGIIKVFLDILFGFATSVYGFRGIMMAGMMVNVLGSLIAAFALTPTHLVIASVLWGAGIGAFYVARHVFIAKAVPRDIRGRLMSILGGGFRWCSFFGPALGGALMEVAGCRVAAFFLAPLCAVCAYVVSVDEKIYAEDNRMGEGEERGGICAEIRNMAVAFWKYWDVVLRVGGYAFNIVCLRQARRLLLALAAMNMGLSSSMVGVVLGLSFVVDASLFFLGGYIMDKFGRKYAAIPTTVNLGFAFFLLVWARTPLSLILVALFFGLADSVGAGVLLTLTADHLPPSGGAPFMGLMRTVQDAGQAVGPVACGLIIEYFSFSSACCVMGGVGLFNGMWAFLMIPEKSLTQVEEEEAAARVEVDAVTTVSEEEMRKDISDATTPDGDLFLSEECLLVATRETLGTGLNCTDEDS
ncbi:putative transporter [Trypanosoma grayi]|uniref:putative transporter n=1 Tax=Trypanosoma grayi TaxID=71804 RepID=UPI0004F43AA8|nr:putative transporter [Trypanosoma grayi]KEG11607.1 putative transporter [Trypanosoma grayi]